MSKAFNSRDQSKQSLSDQPKAEMAEWEKRNGPVKTAPIAEKDTMQPKANGHMQLTIGLSRAKRKRMMESEL